MLENLELTETRSSNPDEDCPTEEFTLGEPSGECWGDGHYMCKLCKNYRLDFKEGGQEYIDFVHDLQGGLIFTLLD